MSKNPIDQVTGAGAKYVAAGRKAQAAMAGKRMGQAHNAGMAGMFAHSETAPASANPAPPTGTEHLSGSQFSGAQFRGKPAGQSSSMLPGASGMGHGSVKRTTPMHPGGAGMGGGRFVVSTPKPKANPNYIPGGGNTVASGNASPNTSAPKAGPSQSAGAAYWTGLGMGGGTAQPKVRGNAKPMGGSPAKGGMRSAIKQKLSGGKGSSGKRGGIRTFKSRFEGSNSKHLKNATGAA